MSQYRPIDVARLERIAIIPGAAEPDEICAMAAELFELRQAMQATHRHKGRGTEYVLIGIGKMQAEWWRYWIGPARDTFVTADMAEVAIYRSVTVPTEIWVRPLDEFNDGRFEVLK